MTTPAPRFFRRLTMNTLRRLRSWSKRCNCTQLTLVDAGITAHEDYESGACGSGFEAGEHNLLIDSNQNPSDRLTRSFGDFLIDLGREVCEKGMKQTAREECAKERNDG